MGGFALDNSRHHRTFPLPDGRSRLTLTTKAIRFLAKHEPDLLPDISEEYIVDKSKTNSFAKSFVCIQVLWFCLQAVGRLAIGLPITLLELHTFAQVFFSLFTYMIWWSKPLDILEPTLILVNDSVKGGNIATAMILRSSIGFFQKCSVGVTESHTSDRSKNFVLSNGALEFVQDVDEVKEDLCVDSELSSPQQVLISFPENLA